MIRAADLREVVGCKSSRPVRVGIAAVVFALSMAIAGCGADPAPGSGTESVAATEAPLVPPGCLITPPPKVVATICTNDPIAVGLATVTAACGASVVTGQVIASNGLALT